MSLRICGLNINGWHDEAFRNWDAETGKESEPIPIDGGLGTVAVRDSTDRWIGGPQALLAPHGRGRGWGELGTPARRVFLRDALAMIREDAEEPRDVLAAAVAALTHDAQHLVFAVPDTPEFDEATRAALLGVMPGHRLLWRSVAAFLGAMQDGSITPEDEGLSFRFLIHSGNGFEAQSLRLRRDGNRPAHLAPEREGPGTLQWPGLGLEPMLQTVSERVADANPNLREEPCEPSALPIKRLLGGARAHDREILRHDNGTWVECVAPLLDADEVIGTRLSELSEHAQPTVQRTFLLTPVASAIRDKLCEMLRPLYPELRTLPWNAIARGCLHAGRLIEQGLPHYFDHLTPVSLAVIDAATAEPLFKNLIRAEATVPANSEYVSPPSSVLKWPRGKKEMSFYILKGDREVRHWQVDMREGPVRDAPVVLRLRQTPGQSWARLSLTSPEWEQLSRAPILLDWAGLDPIDKTPDEVLEELRTPPPVIPHRLVEAAHSDFWVGIEGLGGMNAMLCGTDGDERKIADLSAMLPRQRRDPVSFARTRAINSDGQLPQDMPEKARLAFERLLGRASDQVLRATGHSPLRSNHELKIVTWSFTRCPGEVQERLVDAVEGYAHEREHPLHRGARRCKTVIIQGAGRTVTGEARLHRLLRALAALPPDTDTMNALGMILSRRAEAPGALDRELTTGIAAVLAQQLEWLLAQQSFQIRFFNTLSALAGLFRYREIDRTILLDGRDPVASQMHRTIAQFISSFSTRQHFDRKTQNALSLLQSVQSYLEGGGDPNLLIDIEKAGTTEPTTES